MKEVCIIVMIICFIWWSLWLRIKLRRNSKNVADKEVIQTPLSQAVQELVATAGGVYLSLIMLISFLRIDIMDKIDLLGVSLDPVASTAMGLAIIQPLFLKIIKKE